MEPKLNQKQLKKMISDLIIFKKKVIKNNLNMDIKIIDDNINKLKYKLELQKKLYFRNKLDKVHL